MKRPFIVFTAKQVFEAMQRAQARVVPGEVDTSDALADELNALLNERGTRVTACKLHQGKACGQWSDTYNDDVRALCTHEALLLGQREIEA